MPTAISPTLLGHDFHAESQQGIQSQSPTSNAPHILPQEQTVLLDKFMETLHHALPIFFQPITLATPLRSQELSQVICILMAKLTNFRLASISSTELDAHIQLLLGPTDIYEQCLGHLSLDQMRRACLISFYEFHQFPGHQAWEKVAKLVRAAYWMGLDRLDDPNSLVGAEQATGLDCDGISLRDEDRDEWRMLWWCIYRLDSYANFAAGTPYMIHEDFAVTELLRKSQHAGALYLHPELDKLRQLIPVITEAANSAKLFNLHLVTTATLRSVRRGFQQEFGFRRQIDDVDLVRSAMVERQLNAIRLTLPASYMNPMRNALASESKLDHHSRLVTTLHLHMARLIIAMRHCGSFSVGDGWLLKWQQVLESAQDIALIAEQWDSTFCLCVDPATSYIFFTALVFIHFHKKCALPENVSQTELGHLETVLLLQLEQFASIWMLPRLLILSFKSIQESVEGVLEHQQIRLLVTQFAPPLHPRWLGFLASMRVQLRKSYDVTNEEE